MEKYAPIVLKRRPFRGCHARQSGFSLVEVAVALGIVAFGMMAVFGLLPAGMDTFRQSINTTVSSQILQKVINEAQETDFDQLIKDKENNPISSGTTGVKAIRYFDEQGKELTAAIGAVYHVNTRIQLANTSLNLATVTIQVANNPGSRALAYEQDSTLSDLWSGAYQGNSTRAVSMFTASTMISRQ